MLTFYLEALYIGIVFTLFHKFILISALQSGSNKRGSYLSFRFVSYITLMPQGNFITRKVKTGDENNVLSIDHGLKVGHLVAEWLVHQTSVREVPGSDPPLS